MSPFKFHARCVARSAASAFAFIALTVATPAAADPPAWAPAHGYRAKQAQTGYVVHPYGPARPSGYVVYGVPYGVDRGYCDRPLLSRELIGGVVGGAAGGVIGNQVGKGAGRTAATIGGIVVGALVGASIGRSMDNVDQRCVGYALEHAPDKRRVAWSNAENGYDYTVEPTRTFERDGRYCREYQTTATIDGRRQNVYGTACRQSDGTWQLVN